MIRTTVEIDLRDEPAGNDRIVVSPRGHRTASKSVQPHIEVAVSPVVLLSVSIAGAQQLQLDLAEAIALARKPKPEAP